MTEVDLVLAEFARRLSETEHELREVKASMRASQLSYSSVDIGTGRGYIPFFKNGVEMLRLGRMPDGSVTTASVNDPTPPAVPKPPAVEPGIQSLIIGCEGLEGDIKFSFRHVNVYVDGMLDGRITRLPGIWPSVGLDPSTTHSVQLSAVSQSGIESAKTAPVSVKPISVVEDLGPITETMIADDSISSPMMKTAVLLARHFTVGAVEADAIKAGVISAVHLAAQIVLANTAVIAGDPLGQNTQLNPNGLEQYGVDGQLLVAIGANPGGGNVFTIVDPANVENLLAAISSDGIITASGFSINGEATFNGESLYEKLDALPAGLVAYGRSTANSGSTTSERGIFELSFVAVPGRLYEFTSSSIFVKNGEGAIRVHYTTNGTRPTVSSPILTDSSATDSYTRTTAGAGSGSTSSTSTGSTNSAGSGTTTSTGAAPSAPGGAFATSSTGSAPSAPGGGDGHTHIIGGHNHGAPSHTHVIGGHDHDYGSHSHNSDDNHSHTVGSHSHDLALPLSPAIIGCVETFGTQQVTVQLLVTVVSYGGRSVYAGPPVGSGGMQFTVKDIGRALTAVGGVADGSGTGSGSGTRRTGTWLMDWNEHWGGGGLSASPNENSLFQGRGSNNANHVSLMGMNDAGANLRTTLAGATIVSVELYLYSYNWYSSSGGYACISTHNQTSRPTGAYPNSGVNKDVVQQKMSNPQGLWITLPVAVGNALRDGTLRGFGLDSRNRSDDSARKNFGMFKVDDYKPRVRIVYIK